MPSSAETTSGNDNDDPPAYLEKINHPALDVFLSQTISYQDGYYRVKPYDMIFPKSYLKFDQRIRDFNIEMDDVWIATSIKSGKHTPVLVPPRQFFSQW